MIKKLLRILSTIIVSIAFMLGMFGSILDYDFSYFDITSISVFDMFKFDDGGTTAFAICYIVILLGIGCTVVYSHLKNKPMRGIVLPVFFIVALILIKILGVNVLDFLDDKISGTFITAIVLSVLGTILWSISYEKTDLSLIDEIRNMIDKK